MVLRFLACFINLFLSPSLAPSCWCKRLRKVRRASKPPGTLNYDNYSDLESKAQQEALLTTKTGYDLSGRIFVEVFMNCSSLAKQRLNKSRWVPARNPIEVFSKHIVPNRKDYKNKTEKSAKFPRRTLLQLLVFSVSVHDSVRDGLTRN